MNESSANELWEKMIFFSGYGFNKCLHDEEEVVMKDGSCKKIKDIKIGDFILSYDNDTKKDVYVEVIDVVDTGNKMCFKNEIEVGKQITCPLEHKIVYEGKKQTIADLIIGSNVEFA